MFDCWMSLDLDYATRLAHRADEWGLKWIEEALLPDDYWGYAELRRRVPSQMLITTGEHEATRWGFRLLVDMNCCDILQPDVGWCGGITELRRVFGVGRRSRQARSAARVERVLVPLRCHAAQQPIRRVHHDASGGQRSRADVLTVAVERTGARARPAEGSRPARIRGRDRSGLQVGTPLHSLG